MGPGAKGGASRDGVSVSSRAANLADGLQPFVDLRGRCRSASTSAKWKRRRVFVIELAADAADLPISTKLLITPAPKSDTRADLKGSAACGCPASFLSLGVIVANSPVALVARRQRPGFEPHCQCRQSASLSRVLVASP
jgi:hypothetical protein